MSLKFASDKPETKEGNAPNVLWSQNMVTGRTCLTTDCRAAVLSKTCV